MRNKRFFIVLVGALLFGVLAAVSVSKYLSSAQAYQSTLNKIAVAKVAIPIGSKIIPEQIMVVQFPKDSTPDGAFDSPEKLAGRVAVMKPGRACFTRWRGPRRPNARPTGSASSAGRST